MHSMAQIPTERERGQGRHRDREPYGHRGGIAEGTFIGVIVPGAGRYLLIHEAAEHRRPDDRGDHAGRGYSSQDHQ
ncbi:Uncharacterised protein [Mycobacteroides abscessus subsp. abscessus]|nr:Uncharacterised protein [Mycobacteroides abscessus subsp. abscessus]